MNKLLSLCLISIIIPVSCNRVQIKEGLTIIRNVNIINPIDEVVEFNMDVSIYKERIIEIGKDLDQNGEFEIEGSNKYLLPGLIDSHVHIRDTSNLKLFLYHGVTTVRDMGGQIGEPLLWSRQVGNKEIMGPEIVASSPIISDSDSTIYSYPKSSEHAIQLITQYKNLGYSWIKTFRLNKRNFMQIASTANRLGIPFGGHLPFTKQDFIAQGDTFTIYDVIRSGISSIEHVDELSNLFLNAEAEKIEALADSLLKYNVSVVTITWQNRLIAGIIDSSQEFDLIEQDSIVHFYAGEEGQKKFKQTSDFLKSDNAPEVARNLTEIVPDQSRTMLQILKNKGVKLVVGTDTHNGPNVSGLGVHNELNSLKEYGFSAFEVLRSSTSDAALLLNIEDLGQVKVDYQADLILLNSNPLENLEGLMDIEGIFLDGLWIDKKRLNNYLKLYVTR